LRDGSGRDDSVRGSKLSAGQLCFAFWNRSLTPDTLRVKLSGRDCQGEI